MGKKFEKGNQAAKGHGRPPVPPDLKAVKALSKTLVEKTIAKYAAMSLEDLALASEDKSLPMLDHMTIAITQKAFDDADQKRFDFLLDRSVGKVKEVKELILPEPTFIERPDGRVIEMGVAKALVDEGSDGDG
jgi:hypothetical protein